MRPSLRTTAWVLRVSVLVTVLATVAMPAAADGAGMALRARAVASWPQQGYDETHRSVNPLETVLGTSNVAQLTLAWHSFPGQSNTSPVEADGKLFVTTFDTSVLMAMDASTGATLWTFGSEPYSSVDTPAVASGSVYVAIQQTLYRLDEVTGSVRWSLPIGVSIPAVAATTQGPVTTLYVAEGDSVWAIDGDTGRVMWRQTPAPSYGIQVSPTIGNGLVYVADDKLVLHAYYAASGVEAWSLPIQQGTGQPTTVALDGTLLLVGITGRLITAVDALSGAIRWSRHGDIDSNIAVGNGTVYFESRRPYPAPLRMMALAEATGHVVWRSELGANGPVGLNLGPSVANGVVYATSAAGAVVAFDATTGARLWMDRTVGVTVTNPAIVNVMVYVASYQGVFAFGLPG